MSKTYHDLEREATEIVSQRNPDVSKFTKDELVWMYIQGYIVATQDNFDNERKKT